jgi:hypothetical protein
MNQNNRKKDVKVNLVKYGRAQVVGLVPPKKRSGANVYLITKKIWRPDFYRTDTTHELNPQEIEFARALNLTPRNSMTPRAPQIAAASYIWQTIPWVSGRNGVRPSPKDLEYFDEFGCVRRGKADFVGVINKENNTDPDVSPETLASNLTVARSQTPLDFIYARA